MKNYTMYMVLAFALVALGIYSGVTKGIKRTFDTDPIEDNYDSQSSVRTQSEKTAALQERNERLMDDVRAKMERLKRD